MEPSQRETLAFRVRVPAEVASAAWRNESFPIKSRWTCRKCILMLYLLTHCGQDISCACQKTDN